MSDDPKWEEFSKLMRELDGTPVTSEAMTRVANKFLDAIADQIDEEVEAGLRAIHGRPLVSYGAFVIAQLAIGTAGLRSLGLEDVSTRVLARAATILSHRVKLVSSDRAAELTDEELLNAMRLGAKVPKIGKA